MNLIESEAMSCLEPLTEELLNTDDVSEVTKYLDADTKKLFWKIYERSLLEKWWKYTKEDIKTGMGLTRYLRFLNRSVPKDYSMKNCDDCPHPAMLPTKLKLCWDAALRKKRFNARDESILRKCYSQYGGLDVAKILQKYLYDQRMSYLDDPSSGESQEVRRQAIKDALSKMSIADTIAVLETLKKSKPRSDELEKSRKCLQSLVNLSANEFVTSGDSDSESTQG
jgi:hypothetical protein